MPIHYVEDYEELTGKKRETEEAPAAKTVEAKVVSAPEFPKPAESGSVAEVK